ncbi:MAG: HAMP domain-containing histidine kinase [Tannerella sp.]|jgi:two-component system phosphate regulon sensor histidine kinase PhoR|nr:HAMP domain-containing histidine kinase [Tannerella sp.]
MKIHFVEAITTIALVALLSIQGIWLYNTYNLLYHNLIATFDEGFARSIEKEVYLRLDNNNSERYNDDKALKIVAGARPDQDFYSNALAFHEFLLTFDIPMSLKTMDSIWSQRIRDEVPGTVKYRLIHTDADGMVIEEINRGANENSTDKLIIERPIRNDRSESLRVMIDSPYKIVISNMMVLLITSIVVAMILGYCLFLQVRMIRRQMMITQVRHDFIDGMVHNMKNPVAGIQISANFLKSGKLDNNTEMKETFIDSLLTNANRLLAFTNQILTVSHDTSNNIKLNKRDVDLNELFDRLIAEYILSPGNGIGFVTDMADHTIIHADNDMMIEVFRNLIDNAIKYSKDNIEIRISAENRQHDTVISIRDNGIGIARKDLKRIFDKYERAASHDKRKIGGFGLGLYFVNLAVTAHGGSVSVKSVPGEWSEFIIQIPNVKS